MKRIPVYIPDEHHEEIRELAHVKKTSMAEEVRKAVAEYLRKDPCCEYMTIVNGRCMSCEKMREREGK
jgi:hypothetical protein